MGDQRGAAGGLRRCDNRCQAWRRVKRWYTGGEMWGGEVAAVRVRV